MLTGSSVGIRYNRTRAPAVGSSNSGDKEVILDTPALGHDPLIWRVIHIHLSRLDRCQSDFRWDLAHRPMLVRLPLRGHPMGLQMDRAVGF